MCVCVHTHVYDVHDGRYAHLEACKRFRASVIMHITGALKVWANFLIYKQELILGRDLSCSAHTCYGTRRAILTPTKM